jgi:hypothetical protein
MVMEQDRVRLGSIALIVVLFAGCSTGPTPSPGLSSGPVAPGASATEPSTATARPTASPPATPAPAPSGHRLLPTGFAVALEPGTYWSSPPFDLGFAFELTEPGWVAGHLNGEFVDIQRFEGEAAVGVVPERIIGFGHPLEIHGTTVVEAAGLTPDEAVGLWVERTDIETANVTELVLLGGDAVRVDVHAPTPMLPLFGGDDGTFRLDGSFHVRIVAIAVDGGLFLATVHAPAADLEAAWEQALPVLESIDLVR